MKSKTIVFILIAFSFVAGVFLYPYLPEEMASHWNISGEVDGYLPKFWGLFLMPFISLFFVLLLNYIPKIDPLKKNFKKFRTYYDGFILALVVFLFFIYGISIFWNLGFNFNVGRFVVPVAGILFYYLGFILPKVKRNWFIGFRTPWTLSSDEVWEKTNKMAGKFFKTTGSIAILGLFFPQFIFWPFLIAVIISVIYPSVYSYFLYKKIK